MSQKFKTITCKKLEHYLDQLLQPWLMHDYCPNGLQVAGTERIGKVITGVTASEALIDAAIDRKADALLVHHGYFWKGENETITGMKKVRLKKLLLHDCNLFAYHLPLDMLPELGNNAQLAQILAINTERALQPWNKQCVALKGHFDPPITASALSARITAKLGRVPLYEAGISKSINTIAWCTGGGQHYIETAASQDIDAFISGEASEQTIHVAREMGIHFFAAGHHATERYGVLALGQHLSGHFGLEVEFIDIDNPV